MPTHPDLMLNSDSTLLRKMRRDGSDSKGRVKKSAFMPRANGNDRDGLSVSIKVDFWRALHRSKFVDEKCRACSISVRSIEQLNSYLENIRLDVILSNDDPDDPAHALITGIPDRTSGVEALAAAEFIADKLSKLARLYDF